MTIKKAFAGSMLIFLLAFALGIRFAGTQVVFAQDSQPTAEPAELLPVQETVQAGVEDAIRSAFQETVDQNRSLILGFQVYDVVIDSIRYANDGQTALLWLALQDRATGEVVETEPGLSIATVTPGALPTESASWNFLLPTETDFTERLRGLPAELLTTDIQDRFLAPAEEAQLTAPAVFSGYRLPWTAGVAKRVTNSIGHVVSVSGGLTSCATTCRYAFDFADGTMFPMLAAKGGTVKSVRWSCANFNQDCTNYLILEDPSTSPTSYQVYYHLAHNTIPERLRTVGAVVRQGEFIGDADDTGFSTGHHLHFHVYTAPTAANWTWGRSVDITFDDVSDNGGRPRTCAEAREHPELGSQCQTGNYYTSGNKPANPPIGSLSSPGDRVALTNRTLQVAGTASDDLQITRILVQTNYDGGWKTIDEITPAGNGPFSKNVDLCTSGIPDGPFSLAVRVYDREGSQAEGIPVRQLIKNFSNCTEAPPAPISACVPSANQVALYAEPDYRGACKLFSVNNTRGYTADTFGTLGNNKAQSIQVGSGVTAVVYDSTYDVAAARPSGRVESFTSSDPGLRDNRISSNTISGLWVVSRSALPLAPVIHPIGNNRSGNRTTSADSLVLSWDGGERATAFDTRLTGPGVDRRETVSGNSISVGTLPEGAFTFVVSARNANGSKSSQVNFTVTAAALPNGTARAVPFKDTMEGGTNGWTATGLWRLGDTNFQKRGATKAWIFNQNGSFAHDTLKAGDLTSPPIAIPATGTYYLNYAYFVETEDGGTYWDQRSVQISQNGGPFHPIYQPRDDKMENGAIWTYSEPLSLKDYAGSTIRVRFHFDAIDVLNNALLGWIIDDVSIDTQGPNLDCVDNNNTPTTAQPISFGALASGMICPMGDIDYYKITARAGQQLVVDITAKKLNPPSKLDSLVQLIDADGRSILAENDDEVLVTLQDSLLSYVIGRPGTYFIKVKAWNYPGAAGMDYPYQISISQDTPVPPNDIQITYPTANKSPLMPFTISATAADYDWQPVAKVDFFWHSGDWSKSWVRLGTDIDGSDGWSHYIDPREYGDLTGGALYVQAVSRSGGTRGMVRWNLQPDISPPTSQMNALPATWNSTAVRLTWTASDAMNDIDYFQVEYQENTGSGFSTWKVWSYRLPGSQRLGWFVGKPGAQYNFRMRAVDKAGNVEAYPAIREAATTLPRTCTPDPRENGVTADNPFALARGTSPVFNFCKSAQDGSGDVDWMEFSAKAGEEIMFMLVPRGGGGAMFQSSIYSAQSAFLGTWASNSSGDPLVFRFHAPAAGQYYLEIKPTTAGLFGTNAQYIITSSEPNVLYMPLMGR